MLSALSTTLAATADAVDSTSGWLESHASALITSGVIIVVAIILNWVLRRVIRHGVDGLTKVRTVRRERAQLSGAEAELGQGEAERMHVKAIQGERAEQRARTLGSLLRYATTIVIATIALLMVLSELGINIAPLIAGAGIVGVALGFGAQSLVKDFLSGMFMLMEDQYGVGRHHRRG